jgi:hypothetical protein
MSISELQAKTNLAALIGAGRPSKKKKTETVLPKRAPVEEEKEEMPPGRTFSVSQDLNVGA